MNLDTALTLVASQLDLDAKQLIKYAKEDTIQGYYDGGGQYSIPFTSDGAFLYALVRALRPYNVLEIGTARGGSARHILEALEKNKRGELVTVDINPTATCEGIPEHLHHRLSAIIEDAEMWLTRETKSSSFTDDWSGYQAEFVHEDGAHSAHLVHAVYNFVPALMPSGGVIVSHDTATGIFSDIRQGITSAGFVMPPTYEWDSSPCGFSVMKYQPK